MSPLQRSIRLISRFGAVAVLLFLWACSDENLASPGQSPVASVEVAGRPAALQPGDTVRLSATARGRDGQVLPGRSIEWTSADTAVAVVSASGLVTARAAGNAAIVARVEAKQGSALLTVLPPAVDSVAVLPAEVSVETSGTVQFSAAALDRYGHPLERAIAWRSSDPAVALVDQTGAVLAVGAGTARITASSEGKEGHGTLVVRPVAVARLEPTTGGVVTLYTAETRQLAVRAYAADGSQLFGRTVTWRSANEAIATVSATGLVAARAVGNADVIAEVEGVSAPISIDVRTRIARITITPAAYVLGPGEEAQPEVIVRDVDGGVLERPLTWITSNPAVASVDSTGRVRALAAGTAVVRAVAEGQEGWLDIRVVPWVTRPLQQVGDSLPPATLFTRPTADGTNRTVRVVAREGFFRFVQTGANNGRYELYFSVWQQVDGQGGDFSTYVYRGDFAYDQFTREFVLHSYAGQTQRATFLADGRVRITGALEAGATPVTLLYGPQQ